MEIRLVLNGLDCANCANKIETKVNKINGVKEATVNFSTTLLIAEIKEESLKDEIINEIIKDIKTTILIKIVVFLFINYYTY